MILPNGMFDFAVPELVPERWQPWQNTGERIYFHSMEGNRGGYDVAKDPTRPGILWTGTIAKDGTLYQRAPWRTGLFHGGPNANPWGPGFELEGGVDDGIEGVDEPATEAQIQTALRIIADIEAETGHLFIRDGTNADWRLVEHREADQTACPSNRYDELWARYNAGERYGGTNMADEALRRAMVSGGEEAHLPEAERQANIDYRLKLYGEQEQSLASQVGSLAAGVKEIAQALRDVVIDGTEPDVDDLLERMTALETKVSAAGAALGGNP